MLSQQPPEAAAQSQASHTDRRMASERYGQARSLRGGVQLSGANSGFHAYGAVLAVHADALHR